MYFGACGTDAFDGRVGEGNEAYQADVAGSLTTEIHANSVRLGGVCTGRWCLSLVTNGGSPLVSHGAFTIPGARGRTVHMRIPACRKNGGVLCA